MIVNRTPNVDAALRSDPVLAIAVEAMRRLDRPGWLNLSRSSKTGPFRAIYYPSHDVRHEGRGEYLETAILRAMDAADAAA